jgi:hypothetical protein
MKFYKENVITYNLVFKYMKITYFAFLVLLFALSFSTLRLVWNILLYFHLKTDIQSSLIPFVYILVITIAMVFLLNTKAKKIVRKKFKLRIKGFSWRNDEFDRIQSNILIEHLKVKNLYKEEKLKQLIDLIYKDIERKKLPSLIAPTIFISLFVPIWVQYLTIVFKEIKDSQSAILMAGSITVLLVLVMTSITLSKLMLKETFEYVWMSESLLRRNLANKLEEILVEYEQDTMSEKE